MIRLHNSKTRVKEEFTPIDPNNVRMYVCGPTVYDRAHLGNGRPVVVFDVLFRLLRHVYGEGHVTYVRNFTDVDDKINATALARKAAGDPRSLEALIHERTEETIGWYHADMDALGALRPTHEPRATEYIGAMVAMIEDLIAKGHAYAKEGHALFRVRSYKDYGALSGRSVDDMIAGARVEVAPFKEDPMDFVLWKPSSGDEPGWESPWGRGRPGWHIECSAMADDLLWQKPKKDGQLSKAGLQHPHSFDIHGGGLDLQFPHHENEIAQSCCAHATEDDPLGRSKFARYWMHNEMLQVEGKKMSKSLGNFFTVRNLLEGDLKYPGEVIRFVYLSTHYRKPMDWTADKAREAEATLRKFYAIAAEALDNAEPYVGVVNALCDDLNTAGAISELHQLAISNDAPSLRASLKLMGLMDTGIPTWVQKIDFYEQAMKKLHFVLRERAKAKNEKDFARADMIRKLLADFGVTITDMPGGKVKPTTSFDRAALFFEHMSHEERRLKFGKLLGDDNKTIDAMALGDFYLAHVADEVTKALK